MLKTGSFIVVCLVSLGWIGWNALELFQRGVELSPELVFSTSDEEVLVVNQFKDEDLSELSFPLSSEQMALMKGLSKSEQIELTHIYISKKRPLILIETKQEWNEELCLNVFQSFHGFGTIKADKWGTFSYGDYFVQIDANLLLISTPEYQLNAQKSKFEFDRLGAFSLVHLKDKLLLHSDFYLNEDQNFVFKKTKSNFFPTPVVDDAQQFGQYIAKDITAYKFIERDYLAQFDKDFKNSLIKDWMNSGAVEVEYRDEPILITDFLSGNDPLNVLTKKLDPSSVDLGQSSFVHQNLGLDWNTKSPVTHFFQIIDNYIFIGHNQAALNQFCAQVKLGNTISSNQRMMQLLFGDVPGRVHERSWSDRMVQTIVNYNKFQLSSRKIKKTLAQNILAGENNSSSIQMPAKGSISGYKHALRSNFSVLTQANGELLIYENDRINFSMNLGEVVVGKIHLATSDGSQPKFLVSTKTKVHLINGLGEEAPNYPIQFSSNLTHAPTLFAGTDGPYFLVPMTGGKIDVYREKGTKYKSFDVDGVEFARPLEFWTSQGKPFMGARSQTEFVMVNGVSLDDSHWQPKLGH